MLGMAGRWPGAGWVLTGAKKRLKAECGQVAAPLAGDDGLTAGEVYHGGRLQRAGAGVYHGGHIVLITVADVLRIVERLCFTTRY